jgi:hypothetical protein
MWWEGASLDTWDMDGKVILHWNSENMTQVLN